MLKLPVDGSAKGAGSSTVGRLGMAPQGRQKLHRKGWRPAPAAVLGARGASWSVLGRSSPAHKYHSTGRYPRPLAAPHREASLGMRSCARSAAAEAAQASTTAAAQSSFMAFMAGAVGLRWDKVQGRQCLT